MQEATIETIPIECALEIFSYAAPTRRGLATLALVSRSFHRLSEYDVLWKSAFERLSSAHLVARIQREVLDQTQSTGTSSGTCRRSNLNVCVDRDGINGTRLQKSGWKEWTRLLFHTKVEINAFSTTATSTIGFRTPRNIPLSGGKCAKVCLRKVRLARVFVNAALSTIGMPSRKVHVWLVEMPSKWKRLQSGTSKDDASSFLPWRLLCALQSGTVKDDAPSFLPRRLLYAPATDRPLAYDQNGFWWESLWTDALLEHQRGSDCTTTDIVLPVNVLIQCFECAHAPKLTVLPCVLALNASPLDHKDRLPREWHLSWYDDSLQASEHGLFLSHTNRCGGLCGADS